jgi:hypothetical protein
VETVALEPRYDLRPRGSRRKPLADAWALFQYGRQARKLGRSIAELPAKPA